MSDRRLPAGTTPWEVLAGDLAQLRRELDDLRGTVLARTSGLSQHVIASEAVSGANEWIVSGIPQGYEDLELVVTRRHVGTALTSIRLQFNGDAGANYSLYLQWWDDGTAGISQAHGQNHGAVGFMGGGAGSGGVCKATITAYATNLRTLVACHGWARQGSTQRVWVGGSQHAVTVSPVTSIRVFTASGDNFDGARFSLRGLR